MGGKEGELARSINTREERRGGGAPRKEKVEQRGESN